MILVWQKGNLADAPDSNSLLWEHTDVIPHGLKAYIAGIPIWVDLTWATSDEDLSLRNPRYKTLINSIIARVRDIPPEELIGEEIRVFRRNLRIRNWGVTALVLLLITTTAAAGFGWWQLNKARSTILMNQSDNVLGQDQTIALQFAKEAYTTVLGKPTTVLNDTLLKAFYHEGFDLSTNYSQKLQHQEGVTCATFSRTGEMIETGSVYGKITVWSSDGAMLSSFTAQRFNILSANISADQTQILTTHRKKVACFDLNERRVVKRFQPRDVVISTTVTSPDAKHILFKRKDGTIAIWTSAGKMRSAFKPQGKEIQFVDFVGTGKRVFVATDSNRGSLWDLDGRLIITFAGHSKSISAAAISPDGRWFLTASLDGTVKLWPMTAAANSFCDAEFPDVADFDIGPTDDALLLLVDTEQRAHFRNRQQSVAISDLERENDVQSAIFSPQGDIVTIHPQGNELKFWSKRGQFLGKCCQHPDPIVKAQFSPDGSLIETRSRSKDERIKLWTADGQRFAIPGIEGESIDRIIFARDAKRFFINTQRQAFVFDRDKNKISLDLTNHAFIAFGVRFSPDGQSLLVASEDEIKIYDLEDPHAPIVVEDNDIYGGHIRWLPNSEGFILASTGGLVGVWDRNGERRYQWRALGESGSFYPRPSPDSANILNVKTGALYNLQGDQLNTIGRDRFITYLPNGAYLLSILESQGRERPDTLYLRDRYGNVVVSLGAIKGEIGETKISADARLIAVRTHDNDLVLRCTPEGIVDELAQTQRYTPDTFDRLKHGIDW